MPETRRRFDPDFKEDRSGSSERQVSRAQVARDLAVHDGTLGNWVAKDRAERGESEGL